VSTVGIFLHVLITSVKAYVAMNNVSFYHPYSEANSKGRSAEKAMGTATD